MMRQEAGMSGMLMKWKMIYEVVLRVKTIGRESLYHGKLESCRIYYPYVLVFYYIGAFTGHFQCSLHKIAERWVLSCSSLDILLLRKGKTLSACFTSVFERGHGSALEAIARTPLIV